jgi:acyl-CoA thioesterase
MSDPAADATSADGHTSARAAAHAMYDRDRASQGFGMELLSVSPGQASMRMRIREDMLNGHQTCHGGLIFALADSTFAFACNSHNRLSVAAGASIEFLRPARLADELTASAEEKIRGRHTGHYDITVWNQHGKLVAIFHGRSHELPESVTDSPETGRNRPVSP